MPQLALMADSLAQVCCSPCQATPDWLVIGPASCPDLCTRHCDCAQDRCQSLNVTVGLDGGQLGPGLLLTLSGNSLPFDLADSGDTAYGRLVVYNFCV